MEFYCRIIAVVLFPSLYYTHAAFTHWLSHLFCSITIWYNETNLRLVHPLQPLPCICRPLSFNSYYVALYMVYLLTCTYAHVHIRTYTCVKRMFIQYVCIGMHIRTHTHTYIYIYIHWCMCVCIYIYIYMYIYIYIQMYAYKYTYFICSKTPRSSNSSNFKIEGRTICYSQEWETIQKLQFQNRRETIKICCLAAAWQLPISLWK